MYENNNNFEIAYSVFVGYQSVLAGYQIEVSKLLNALLGSNDDTPVSNYGALLESMKEHDSTLSAAADISAFGNTEISPTLKVQETVINKKTSRKRTKVYIDTPDKNVKNLDAFVRFIKTNILAEGILQQGESDCHISNIDAYKTIAKAIDKSSDFPYKLSFSTFPMIMKTVGFKKFSMRSDTVRYNAARTMYFEGICLPDIKI